MKRLIIILLSLVIIYTLVGCSTDEYKKLSKEDKPLVDRVVNYEQSRYDLKNNTITVTEYKNNITNIFSSKFPKAQKVVFGLEGKDYTESDLEKLSDDEVKKLITHWNKIVSENVGEVTYDPILISGVYEDPDMSFRYIFLKTKKSFEKENKEIKVFTKYTFNEENGEWKILSIETKAPREKDNIETLENFKGEQIEYIKELDLSKS